MSDQPPFVPPPPPPPPPPDGADVTAPTDDLKKAWWKRWWAIAGAVLIVLVALAAIFGEGDADDADGDAGIATAEPTSDITDSDGAASDTAQTTTAPVNDEESADTTAPETAPPATDPGTTTSTTEPPVADPVIGTTVTFGDGGLARINAVTPNAPARNQFVTPDPGFSFTEIEVEVCAGTDGWSLNPLYWTGFLEDNTEAGPALGGQDLQTAGLAPGGCGRGWVALNVPDGNTVADIVLLGTMFNERARWTTDGAEAVDGPLIPTSPPTAVSLGEEMSTGNGSTATVRSVTPGVPAPQFVTVDEGRQLIELDVEQCAGTAPLSVNPLYWLLTTQDNYIGQAELGAQTLPTMEVAAGQCIAGTVVMNVPAESTAVFAQLVGPLFDELGRTALN